MATYNLVQGQKQTLTAACLFVTPIISCLWLQARAALALELFVHRYSPITFVPQVKCPILFVAATEDVLCPVDQVHKAVALAPQARLLSRNCTHFELYRGALFEGLIGEQVKFFQQHTGLAAADGSTGKAAAAFRGSS